MMMMIESNTYRRRFPPRGMIFNWQENVMDTQKCLHENISALADGELASSEVELAFAALDTPDGRAAWDIYHLIGHTLRSDRLGADLSAGFSGRLAARLAAEALAEPDAAARHHIALESQADGDADGAGVLPVTSNGLS
jgi:sigma-E factor negative regulatory protein RseA